MMTGPKLTNLQVELLQAFAYPLPDEQLAEIKLLLSRYFLDKADAEMDRLTLINGWDENSVEAWAKGHDRTPYQP